MFRLLKQVSCWLFSKYVFHMFGPIAYAHWVFSRFWKYFTCPQLSKGTEKNLIKENIEFLSLFWSIHNRIIKKWIVTALPSLWGDENIYFTLCEGHNLDAKTKEFLYDHIFMYTLTILSDHWWEITTETLISIIFFLVQHMNLYWVTSN